MIAIGKIDDFDKDQLVRIIEKQTDTINAQNRTINALNRELTHLTKIISKGASS